MKVKIRQSMLQAALQYNRRFGWSVIPIHIVLKDGRCSCRNQNCSDPGKHPCLSSWKEFQKRRPTEEEIRRWWTRWPDAGIAVVCGEISDGLAALDLDKPEVADRALAIERESRSERSPRQGAHFLLISKTPIKSCVLIPGIAELKGDGRLITVAPSRGYKLVHAAPPLQVKNAHEWSVELLKKVGIETPRDTEQAKAYKTLAEDTSLTEGARNNTLASLGGLLRRNGFGVPMIRDVLQAINQTHCHPPLTEEEVGQIAKSVGQYPPSGFVSAALMDISTAETIWVTARALVESPGIDVKWLWDAYVGLGLVTLISSLPKVGKTTLLFHLLRALLRNEPFLGRTVTPPTKILLLTEEPTNLLRRRLQHLGLGDDRLLLIYRYTVQRWHDALVQIKKAIVQEKVDLVVIDTLGAFWEIADENDAAKVITSIRILQDMANEYSVAMILNHHLRKSGGDEGTAHRGSGQLVGAVDIAIEIYRVQGNEHRRRLKAVSRAVETPSDAVVELKKEGNYMYVGTEAQANREETRREIQRIMPKANDEPLTLKELLIELKDRLSPPPKKTLVKELIGELVATEFVDAFGKGVRGDPYHYKLMRMSPKAAKKRGLPPQRG